MDEIGKIFASLTIISGLIIGIFLFIGLYFGFLLKSVLIVAVVTFLFGLIIFIKSYSDSNILNTRKRTLNALSCAGSWISLPYRAIFFPIIVIIDWICKLIENK